MAKHQERTVVIIKPDGIIRGLAGEILQRFERKGFRIVGAKFGHLTDDLLLEHYAHHKEKAFFPKLVEYMKSAPSLILAIEGKNVVSAVRVMGGTTNASEALPGTIRGDYALSIQQNIVHISENLEAAEAEVKRFFKDSELFDYERVDFRAIYSAEEIE